MYRATTYCLIRLLLPVFIVAGCERQQHLVEQQLLEFGTIIEITMITEDLTQAEKLLAEIEQQLRIQRNQWHAWEDSDLTRFNEALDRDASAELPVSLTHLLKLSRHYHEASGGLFNPALGKLVAAHGFHGSEPDADAIAEIKRDIPGMQDLSVEENIAVSSNPHLQIDLGGIAKGYALELLGDYLDKNGIDHYIINAGGDMVTSGNRFGRAWRIGIQNPFAPGVVASLEIEGKQSLFTSGNYHRRYWRGEVLAHHIIDPRNGKASSGQSSATVLNGDPVLADVAATALMIDGLRSYHGLASSLQIEDYLLISEQREIIMSRSMADKVKITASWPISIVD